jgi:class 3 adenylate cyclase
MDAIESPSAVFFTLGTAGAVIAAFAATYPERTSGLVLYNPVARGRWAPDYTWGVSDEKWPAEREQLRNSWATNEGTAAWMAELAPSRAGDSRFVEWWTDQERRTGTVEDFVALAELMHNTDVTATLAAIHVPCVVLARPASLVDRSRYVSDRIPGARLVILPGVDVLALAGDIDPILREVENFIDELSSAPATGDSNRVLATLLFTDIVGSTEMAAQMGDRAWSQLLKSHLERSDRLVRSFRGRVVDTAGDGILASFDGTGRAIRCAAAVVADANEIGLTVRAGLHTGECELVGDSLRGVAVHIGARVATLAGSSEVLVSGTVKDLVAGAGFDFTDRGTHELKGVPGEWHLYAVTGESAPRSSTAVA